MSINGIGEPKRYSPEQFANLVDQYFDDVKDKQASGQEYYATFSGLALHLRLSDNGLLSYRRDDRYAETTNYLEQAIKSGLEQRLLYSNGSATGAIFSLKNLYGWRDSKELALAGVEGKPVETITQIVVVGGKED